MALPQASVILYIRSIVCGQDWTVGRIRNESYRWEENNYLPHHSPQQDQVREYLQHSLPLWLMDYWPSEVSCHSTTICCVTVMALPQASVIRYKFGQSSVDRTGSVGRIRNESDRWWGTVIRCITHHTRIRCGNICSTVYRYG